VDTTDSYQGHSALPGAERGHREERTSVGASQFFQRPFFVSSANSGCLFLLESDGQFAMDRAVVDLSPRGFHLPAASSPWSRSRV
jgi:hypothetical protein